MTLAGLALRNAWRARTRALLTVLGVAIAAAAFGFLRTAVDAYYAGVAASAEDRLVVRNAGSLAVRLPIGYAEKLASQPGVTHVAAADFFGGVYLDEKNWFLNLAVDAEPFLALFPEYQLSDEERRAWLADRTGCIVGDKLARKYHWKPGDVIHLRGTLFPGDWPMTVRGIYRPRDPGTIATQLFFHWRYLDQAAPPERQGEALAFFVGVADPRRSAEVAHAIDARFAGSDVETLSESEKSFQLTFISMAGAVLAVLDLVSVVMLGILTLILAHAIAASVRERTSEIAVMKALGFGAGRLALLVALEAGVLGALGGLLGLGLCSLLVRAFAAFMDQNLGSFFPIFALPRGTALTLVAGAVGLGLASALWPIARVVRLPVAASLRRVG